MNLDVMIQAFLARLLPTQHETLLAAIRHFHFEAYPPAALQAGLGALAGSALLFAIGVWLKRLPERVSTPEQRERIGSVQTKANGLLPWLLVFSPLPVGGAIIIASGFFNMNARKAAVIMVVVEILFRAVPYLHS